MAATSYKPSAPFVEDYDSEDNATLPQTRQYAQSAGKPASNSVQVNGDGHSDSGYSSHTAATVNSADSSGIPYQYQEKRFTLPKMMKPPTSAPDRSSTPSSRNPAKLRPTILTHPDSTAAETGQRSPRKQSSKAAPARSPRKSHYKSNKSCDCQECRPDLQRSSPLDSPWGVDYSQFNERPTRIDSAAPQAARGYQVPYSQEAPTLRPRTASGSGRPRPVSYHHGVSYSMGSAYPSSKGVSPLEMGPPPSRSAYTNVANTIPPSYPPPGSGFVMPPGQFPRQDYGPAYNYDYANGTPNSMRYSNQQWYGQPTGYPSQSPVDRTYPPTETLTMPRRKQVQAAPTDSYFSYETSTDAELMPPPKLPAKQSRPKVHHLATAPTGREILRPSSAASREHVSAPSVPGLSRTRSHRSQSKSRPSTGGRNASNSSGQYTDSDSQRTQRQSYYEDGPSPSERERARQAELYQEEINRAAPKAAVPLTDATLRAARRGSHANSRHGRSEKGSGSRSSTGSEGKTNRESRNGESGFTMRFDQNAKVDLDFSGATESAPLSVRQGEDGKVEISIGASSKRYVEGSSGGGRSDYTRSTGSRRDDDRRSTRDRQSDRKSQRSGRGGDRF